MVSISPQEHNISLDNLSSVHLVIPSSYFEVEGEIVLVAWYLNKQDTSLQNMVHVEPGGSGFPNTCGSEAI